jgi:ABC-2 type transport system permease protein
MFDSWIIAVKEWREWSALRARLSWGALAALIFVWSLVAPHLLGELKAGPLIVAIMSASLPLALSGVMIIDSFAGERERQTLETLLASRLPDQAILLGKVIAVTLAGLALLLVGLLPGVLQNVFAPVAGFKGINLLRLTAGLLAACAPCVPLTVIVGALIALYIPSARLALLMTTAFVGSFVLATTGLVVWWVAQPFYSVEHIAPLLSGSGLAVLICDALLLLWLLLSAHRDRLLAIS